MEQIVLKYQSYSVTVYHQPGNSDNKLVFLHGGGLDDAMMSWKEVIDLLGGQYDIYAVDQLGYGKSDKPHIVYSIPFYVECLHSLFEQLHINKASLAGLSMGGGNSIGFALKYPESVEKLILVDSMGFCERMPFHGLCRRFVNSSLNAKSYRWMGKSKELIRWSLQTSLFGDKSKISESVVDECYRLLNSPDCNVPFESFQRYELGKKTLTTDLMSHLGELKMPVLIVNGEKDSLVPAKSAAAASQVIQNSQLHIMKGCRHWAQKERPEEFVKALESFLQSF